MLIIKNPGVVERNLKIKETKGIERNLQIRKYIEGISYSPSEIKINLKYNPAGGQTLEPVPGGGGTGSRVEQITPSWRAGDRRNVAGICAPADKGSSASCEGRAGRPSEIIVRNEMNGCRGKFLKTIIFTLPNTIHKSKKKNLKK